MNITDAELSNFVHYVYEFYDGKWTHEQIRKAIILYLSLLKTDKDFTWGNGDSIDRERVHTMLNSLIILREGVTNVCT